MATTTGMELSLPGRATDHARHNHPWPERPWHSEGVDVIDWLLDADPAIVWQVQRDLTHEPWDQARSRVAHEGWGAQLLARRLPDGTWPTGWYSPKWTSTFYSLQLLQQLGVPAPESVETLLAQGLQGDGRFKLWPSPKYDECVAAMMLTMATEAGVAMLGTAEWLVDQQRPDGGWNCRHRDSHSSFHTTLSALEGLGGHPATEAGREFLLRHRLFRSHTTGQVARQAFTRFSFPTRWYYDVLRALDYWRAHDWDDRLTDALELVHKRRRDGRWLLQNPHPGRTWFDMETVGKPSRWNTLRALRVLRWAAHEQDADRR